MLIASYMYLIVVLYDKLATPVEAKLVTSTDVETILAASDTEYHDCCLEMWREVCANIQEYLRR